jgi:hypothetical protein
MSITSVILQGHPYTLKKVIWPSQTAQTITTYDDVFSYSPHLLFHLNHRIHIVCHIAYRNPYHIVCHIAYRNPYHTVYHIAYRIVSRTILCTLLWIQFVYRNSYHTILCAILCALCTMLHTVSHVVLFTSIAYHAVHPTEIMLCTTHKPYCVPYCVPHCVLYYAP